MQPSSRAIDPITVITWIALGSLALLVGVSTVGIAGSGGLLIELLPELAPTQGALVALAVAFGVFVEALLVVAGVLVGYIHTDNIFNPSALRWVDALVATVIGATLLVIVALFFIPGPPQLFVLVEAGVPAGVTITLVLLVMRRLLRRAVLMHVELDEVV